jgi:hypothetical protein
MAWVYATRASSPGTKVNAVWFMLSEYPSGQIRRVTKPLLGAALCLEVFNNKPPEGVIHTQLFLSEKALPTGNVHAIEARDRIRM